MTAALRGTTNDIETIFRFLKIFPCSCTAIHRTNKDLSRYDIFIATLQYDQQGSTIFSQIYNFYHVASFAIDLVACK